MGQCILMKVQYCKYAEFSKLRCRQNYLSKRKGIIQRRQWMDGRSGGAAEIQSSISFWPTLKETYHSHCDTLWWTRIGKLVRGDGQITEANAFEGNTLHAAGNLKLENGQKFLVQQITTSVKKTYIQRYNGMLYKLGHIHEFGRQVKDLKS